MAVSGLRSFNLCFRIFVRSFFVVHENLLEVSILAYSLFLSIECGSEIEADFVDDSLYDSLGV